jgi:phosphoribosylaminoimidazole (AIR) synthetase
MKISQLITKLEEVKNREGDIPVFIETSGLGGHAYSLIDRVRESELDGYAFDEADNDGQLYGELLTYVKEYMPNWEPGRDQNGEEYIKFLSIEVDYSFYSI